MPTPSFDQSTSLVGKKEYVEEGMGGNVEMGMKGDQKIREREKVGVGVGGKTYAEERQVGEGEKKM